MMPFDPELHHRRSIRLKGFDYSQPGLYFVTICTWRRELLFGKVANGQVVVNEAGRAVRGAWCEVPRRFVGVELDAFVVMPNHIHGIIELFRAGQAAGKGAASSAPTNAIFLGRIIRAFKSLSGLEASRLLGREGKPLWQRNYYEHIIRRGEDLDEIRRYILENPRHWPEDPENPSHCL